MTAAAATAAASNATSAGVAIKASIAAPYTNVAVIAATSFPHSTTVVNAVPSIAVAVNAATSDVPAVDANCFLPTFFLTKKKILFDKKIFFGLSKAKALQMSRRAPCKLHSSQ